MCKQENNVMENNVQARK